MLHLYSLYLLLFVFSLDSSRLIWVTEPLKYQERFWSTAGDWVKKAWAERGLEAGAKLCLLVLGRNTTQQILSAPSLLTTAFSLGCC